MCGRTARALFQIIIITHNNSVENLYLVANKKVRKSKSKPLQKSKKASKSKSSMRKNTARTRKSKKVVTRKERRNTPSKRRGITNRTGERPAIEDSGAVKEARSSIENIVEDAQKTVEQQPTEQVTNQTTE